MAEKVGDDKLIVQRVWELDSERILFLSIEVKDKIKMKYRVLGKDLKVSSLGLGCMEMSHAYGAPADKEKMIGFIAQVVDLG